SRQILLQRPTFGILLGAAEQSGLRRHPRERIDRTHNVHGVANRHADGLHEQCPRCRLDRRDIARGGQIVLGLKTIATLETCGAASLSKSSRLPATEGSEPLNPVVLPSGRAMFRTRPLATGSPAPVKTIGTVRRTRPSGCACAASGQPAAAP